MQLEVKYDNILGRVCVKDTSTGIIGAMIRVNNEDQAYKIMSELDLDKVREKIQTISDMKGRK